MSTTECVGDTTPFHDYHCSTCYSTPEPDSEVSELDPSWIEPMKAIIDNVRERMGIVGETTTTVENANVTPGGRCGNPECDYCYGTTPEWEDYSTPTPVTTEPANTDDQSQEQSAEEWAATMAQQVADLEDQVDDLNLQLGVECALNDLNTATIEAQQGDFDILLGKTVYLVHTLSAIAVCPDVDVIHATATNALTAILRGDEDLAE